MRGHPLVLSLAVLALSNPGRAEEVLPLELTWTAPAGCATAGDIERELARIARVRPGRTVTRLVAHGSIERLGTSYRLSLHTERNGLAGERSLVAKECRSLEREVTLVLALAFGEGVELVNDAPAAETAPEATVDDAQANTAPPTAETKAAEPTPEATAKAPEPPKAGAEPVASRPPPKESAPRGASNRMRIAGFAGGGALFDTLPSPSGYLVVGSELGVRRFWFEPSFEWLPEVGQSLARGVHARYDGFGGGLRGCAEIPPGRLGFDGCAGVEAFGIRGRSSGASESDEAVAPLVRGVLALGYRWPARGFVALRLSAALHVAFNEPHFVVTGLGDVYAIPRLAPSVGATILFGNPH